MTRKRSAKSHNEYHIGFPHRPQHSDDDGAAMENVASIGSKRCSAVKCCLSFARYDFYWSNCAYAGQHNGRTDCHYNRSSGFRALNDHSCRIHLLHWWKMSCSHCWMESMSWNRWPVTNLWPTMMCQLHQAKWLNPFAVHHCLCWSAMMNLIWLKAVNQLDRIRSVLVH